MLIMVNYWMVMITMVTIVTIMINAGDAGNIAYNDGNDE